MADASIVLWIGSWLFLGAFYCLSPIFFCRGRFYWLDRLCCILPWGDVTSPQNQQINSRIEMNSNTLLSNDQVRVHREYLIQAELQKYSMELPKVISDALANSFSRKNASTALPKEPILSPALKIQQKTQGKDASTTNTSLSEVLLLPKPGIEAHAIQLNSSFHSSDETTEKILMENSFLRPAPTICAICLDSYLTSDVVCWSSNPCCSHVFHQHCILNWLVALNRRPINPAEHEDADADKSVERLRLTCPCCRVPFIGKRKPSEVTSDVSLSYEQNLAVIDEEQIRSSEDENVVVVIVDNE